MSARKYVPNRLRGVLGGDEGGPSSNRSTPSRSKGRKSRPWRIDAASWKQQLQERKAVYDHFALPEKAEEEQKDGSEEPKTSGSATAKKVLPSVIDTSGKNEQGNMVETMVTPKRGENIETILTSSQRTLDSSFDSGDPDGEEVTTSPSKNNGSRKSSPLPRNKSKHEDDPSGPKIRKGKKVASIATQPSPHRTKRIEGFSPESLGRESSYRRDEVEYDLNLDGSDIMASRSKDSNIGIVDGVPSEKKRTMKTFSPKSTVRLLRHGDSDDTAESIGLTSSQEGFQPVSPDVNVNRATMMEAVEEFIDPSIRNTGTRNSLLRRSNVGSSRFVTAAENKPTTRVRSSLVYDGTKSAKMNLSMNDIDYYHTNEVSSGKTRSSPRRGGRRRPRQVPGELDMISPADSNLSTSATINGNSSEKDTSFRSGHRSSGDDADENKSNDTIQTGSDDDWSTRTIPSDEEVCLEKRRWPVRPENDSATLASGDTDINSILNDGISIAKQKGSQRPQRESKCQPTFKLEETEDDELDESESSLENIMLREQIALSLTPSKYEDDFGQVTNETSESSSSKAPFVSPDPLQKARKTLLVSNLNRSMRDLQDTTQSQRGWGDESVDNSSSRSIFVPLRTRDMDLSTKSTAEKESEATKNHCEIPLNVLNDHGVYVSTYNKDGIFVPPRNDDAHSDQGDLMKNLGEDKYNSFGVYVPHENPTNDEKNAAESDVHEEDRPLQGDTSSLSNSHPHSKEMKSLQETDDSDDPEEEVTQSGNDIPQHEEPICSLDKDEGDGEERLAAESSKETDDHDENPIISEPDSKNSILETNSALSGIEQPCEATNSKTREVDEEVEELDAIRIQVLLELQDRVGLIFTGNHNVVESVGMSEESDPLAALRRKREVTRMGPRASMALRLQLNNTVSSLNTDHHHIVESPGTLKSVKGKKWKSRVAMKKAAKKSGTDSKDELDSAIQQISPPLGEDSSPMVKAEHEGEGGKKDVELTIKGGEELATGTANGSCFSELVCEPERQSGDSDLNLKIESLLPSEAQEENPIVEVVETSVNEDHLSDELKSPSVDSVKEMTGSRLNEETTVLGNFSEVVSGIEIDESRLPVANTDIIQGVPPNKGKKWKDRLKKKKDRKVDKSERVKEDDIRIQPNSNLELENTVAEYLSGRPAFNRAISDLTTPPEEKSREASPTNLVQVENTVKNGTKKTNKWKNRLAKMKGSKQETKPKTPDIVPAVDHVDTEFDSTKNQPASPPKIATEKVEDMEPANGLPNIQKVSVPVNENEEYASKTATNDTIVPSTKDDKEIQQDLRQSFNVFDAFLKAGPSGANPIDDESIYTELTIGQESMLQNGKDENDVYDEEELSYMDFTLEESVQPSYIDQTVASNVAPKDQMMSPFMSNLLSSRMFQDIVPTVPAKAFVTEKQEEVALEEKKPKTDGTKKFPTITVGNDFDDDMTQITMGSLEDGAGDEKEIDICVEENFYDARSKPLSPSATISPSAKSLGKRSGRSSNSRRSEGMVSYSSQPSCDESSKQRIAEILRKEVWSSDSSSVKASLEELEVEAKKGYNYRAHIVRCGGVMSIMRAMEMNSESTGIVTTCLSTLEKLALDPQTQTAICEMEGISLVVRSMQNYADNEQLQEAGCSALATICRQQEDETFKDPMKDAEGAVPALLACMTRYPTNSTIQARAFGAIASLCTGLHSHERLMELSSAGGILTLTMALQTPWENKHDHHEAISNLSILLRGIAELHDTTLPFPKEDETSKDTKLDSTSRTSIETESVSTKRTERGETQGQKSGNETNNELPISEYDDQSQGSFVDDIPDIPVLSTRSLQVEDIPDLGDFSAGLPGVEWSNFDPNDPDSFGKKSSAAMSPDRSVGSKHGNEDQCTIQ